MFTRSKTKDQEDQIKEDRDSDGELYEDPIEMTTTMSSFDVHKPEPPLS